jgi:SPP1 gp7 family putative phage head morphogenesis protein
MGEWLTKVYEDVGSKVFDDLMKHKGVEQKAAPKPKPTALVPPSEQGGMPVEVRFDVQNPAVQEFIKNYSYRFSFDVNQETQKLLSESMSQGFALGEDIRDLRERVKKVFGWGSDPSHNYRALRIARTESIRASNYASDEAYAQSGVVIYKEWFTAFDERTCPFCRSMNGKVIAPKGTFIPKGQSLDGDDGKVMVVGYEDIKAPPLHPGCRCTLLPVVEKIPATSRIAPTPQVPGIDLSDKYNFEQWPTFEELDFHKLIPGWENPPEDFHKRRYGIVLVDNNGKILLREPANHFDGYHWTFAKGGMEKSTDNILAVARKELLEETGYQCDIISAVPGSFSTGSGTAKNYFFIGRAKGIPQAFEWETTSIKWANLSEAVELISKSTNIPGRNRDLKILGDAFIELFSLNSKSPQSVAFHMGVNIAKTPVQVVTPVAESINAWKKVTEMVSKEEIEYNTAIQLKELLKLDDNPMVRLPSLSRALNKAKYIDMIGEDLVRLKTQYPKLATLIEKTEDKLTGFQRGNRV